MQLSQLDWAFVIGFFAISLGIGIFVWRTSGRNYTEYFLSGRNMPWWLLGISMVATTFSADTPNLVTDIVRNNGVAGNWVWWAFLLTGLLTVFMYAKLWRRSGVLTDLEFYELRYSGAAATFLRAFRALYLGFFFNVMIMATVMLAAIKIGSVLLGFSPLQTLLIASVVTLIYTAIGGLRGVILTDFFQFAIAMVGTVWAAIHILNMPEIGGLTKLLQHENVSGKLSMLPDFNNLEELIPLLIIPLAVQWWSVWYPGAEPGGGGYIAQRMLSAKDEKNAVSATLLFNAAHYALRPWPWILIALASLVVFPDLEAVRAAFPKVAANVIGDDLAYPAMLTFLPPGLLGLVIASLIAAFMSTISTHLNWGASYLVHDVYLRFYKPEAEGREQVFVGQLSTLLLLVCSGVVALLLSNALGAFQILLQIGAGTGLLFILRWFWWRINAYSEITAMVVSFLIALFFEFIYKDQIASHWELVIGVVATTAAWLAVTFATPPDDLTTLTRFVNLIKPHKRGWKRVILEGTKDGSINYSDLHGSSLASEILAIYYGCLSIYGLLFATGFILYANYAGGAIAGVLAIIGIWNLLRIYPKIVQ